jgi:hypothetical protein
MGSAAPIWASRAIGGANAKRALDGTSGQCARSRQDTWRALDRANMHGARSIAQVDKERDG